MTTPIEERPFVHPRWNDFVTFFADVGLPADAMLHEGVPQARPLADAARALRVAERRKIQWLALDPDGTLVIQRISDQDFLAMANAFNVAFTDLTEVYEAWMRMHLDCGARPVVPGIRP